MFLKINSVVHAFYQMQMEELNFQIFGPMPNQQVIKKNYT